MATVALALAGNPNCGKTTMFNALTGGNEHVGNWPGVTVEKRVGPLRGDKEEARARVADLLARDPNDVRAAMWRRQELRRP